MFAWTRKYSVDVKEIDDQHKQFLKIANGILKYSADKKITRAKLLIELGKFLNYALYHFETEETHFTEFNCPQPGHIEAHNAFRSKYQKLFKLVEKCPEQDMRQHAAEAAEFAGTWILQHILVMDKGYTDCFSEHGLK